MARVEKYFLDDNIFFPPERDRSNFSYEDMSYNYVSRPYPRERPAKTLVFAGWSDRVDRARNLEFRRVKITFSGWALILLEKLLRYFLLLFF